MTMKKYAVAGVSIVVVLSLMALGVPHVCASERDASSAGASNQEAGKVFEKVWYRKAKSSLMRMKAWDASGSLTIGPERIEFTSKKINLSIPVSDIRKVSLGTMKGDMMNEWVRIEYVVDGAETGIGLTGRLSDGVDKIHGAIVSTVSAASSTRSDSGDAASGGGSTTRGALEAQFTINLPKGCTR